MIAVVGAGFAGCVVARFLAEKGKYVVVYEQEQAPGGILLHLQNVSITLADHDLRTWLSERVELLRIGEVSFASAKGSLAMCEELLNYRDLRVQYGVPIVEAWGIAHAFDRVIFTGNVDKFFYTCYGPLPYSSPYTPLESAEAIALLQHYHLLCQRLGVIPFGMRAEHSVLPLHVLLRRARDLVAQI